MSNLSFDNLGFGMNFCLYKYWIKNNKGKPIPKNFMKQMNKEKNKEYKKYIIDNKGYYEEVINSDFFGPLCNIEKKIYKNIGDLDEDEFNPLFTKDEKTEKMVKMKFNIRDFFAIKKSDDLCFLYIEDIINDEDIEKEFEWDIEKELVWFKQDTLDIIFKKIKKDIKNEKEKVILRKFTFNLGGINWYILNIDYNTGCVCPFTYAHSKQRISDFIYYFRTENNRDLMYDYLS